MSRKEELVHLLTKMETDYPEIYTYMDEDPITLEVPKTPKISDKDMANYLESLREILSHYRLSHRHNN